MLLQIGTACTALVLLGCLFWVSIEMIVWKNPGIIAVVVSMWLLLAVTIVLLLIDYKTSWTMEK